MQIRLPKDDVECARMLRRHADRMYDYLSFRRTQWLLAWYYLNGFRRFDVFNPETGLIVPHFLDEEGRMEFQSQELLYAINQVSGRIQSMDLNPAVSTPTTSLQGLRDRALTQIALDGTMGHTAHARAKEEFAWMFACLGFAGICGHVTDHPTIGISNDIEVIHPKELLPFPAQGENHTKVGGLMRERYLPLADVEDLFGKKLGKAMDRDQVEYFEVDPGAAWAEGEALSTMGGAGAPTKTTVVGGSMARRGPIKDSTILVVKMREVWTKTPQDTVGEYVAASGEKTLQREDLGAYEVYCPIGWARFFNNGTFHGAGMFDILFSQHRQLELLQKNLYNNIRDADRYGVLVLPQGTIDQDNFLRDVGHGLKVAFWEPDPISEGQSPTFVKPFDTGDLPGKVAQFAREGLQLINPLKDLIEEKGRVESGPGLQILQEQITRALTSPTSGVQKAWGEMYRSVAQKVSTELVKSPKALPVGALTLDLAGAVIDQKTGFVSFENNPIPSIRWLKFGVKDLSPKSELARKQEAMELFAQGLDPDPMNFKMQAIEDGLDYPIWMRREKGAYETAMKLILGLYGDGDTPGRVKWAPEFVDPDITLRLLEAFIKGPAMAVASKEVRLLMGKLRTLLMGSLGFVLPNAIPNPEDLAAVGLPPEMGDPLSQPPPAGMPAQQMGPQGGGPQGAPDGQQPQQPQEPSGDDFE